jgi:hypothetical protein
MDYNRIVAVTGMPGLYEVLSSKSDGAIVRSLDDKSTKFVSSRIHNLSHLESIEVYTQRDNVTLADVFMAMQQNGVPLPDVKDNKSLKGYFEKVFPELDFERVYTSDMKKMVKWYEVLSANNVDFTVKPAEEDEPESEEVPVAAEPVQPKAKTAKAVKEPVKAEAKVEKQPKAEVKPAKKEEKAPAKTAAKKAAPKKAAEKTATASKTASKKAASKSGTADKKKSTKK